MAEPVSVTNIVAEYDRYLVRRNRSPRTRKMYSWALKDFASFVESHGVVFASSLGREHIAGWEDSLAHMKPGSRSLASTALRQCLLWATKQELPVSPLLYMNVESVHVPERTPRPLPMDDVSKIIAYFRSISQPSVIDLRDRALFLCLLTTGVRVGEALQMTRRDVNRTSILTQKGGRRIPITLIPPVRDALARYVAARVDADPRLWVRLGYGKQVQVLADSGVREIFRRVSKRAGIPRFTTHQLRHTAATRLFERKVPESVITDFLAHGNLDSIRGYVDFTSRRNEAATAMEHMLMEAEGTIPALDVLAANLDLVVAGIDKGIFGSNRNGEPRGVLAAAATALRNLQAT